MGWAMASTELIEVAEKPEGSLKDPVTAAEIRDEIGKELKKTKTDSLRITELANRLTDLETDFVRFTVDASHVDRLGYELVGKQGTALAELVKNSYDADATMVIVDIRNKDETGESSISIQDDGVGMSVEEIKRSWMRISTSTKVDAPVSSRYGRLRAGKKGIGRFAVQRLGKSLVMETSQAGSSTGWRISINWDEQHVKGKDITLVPHTLESFEKDSSHVGARPKLTSKRRRIASRNSVTGCLT